MSYMEKVENNIYIISLNSATFNNKDITNKLIGTIDGGNGESKFFSFVFIPETSINLVIGKCSNIFRSFWNIFEDFKNF